MKLRFYLTTEYRQRVLIEKGTELQPRVTVDIPLQDLSPQARAIVATKINPGLAQETPIELPRNLSSSLTDLWDAPFLPSTPDEWNRFFAVYEADLAARQQKLRSEAQQMLNTFIAEIQEKLAEEKPIIGFQHEKVPFSAKDQLENYDLAARLLDQLKEKIRIYKEEEKVAEAEKEAERERKANEAQAEKKRWVEAYGSAGLRERLQLGYSCHERYVRERAAQEHPGAIVDIRNTARFGECYCPTDEALDLAKRVQGEVVFLTAVPDDGTDYDYTEYGREQVVLVENYLGRYDLIYTL